MSAHTFRLRSLEAADVPVDPLEDDVTPWLRLTGSEVLVRLEVERLASFLAEWLEAHPAPATEVKS